MRSQLAHLRRRFTLLALLMLVLTLLPAASLAQSPTPPVQSSAERDGGVDQQKGADQPTVSVGEQPATDKASEEDAAPLEEARPAGPQASPAVVQSPQGVVSLDVTSADEIRAGDILTYTYTYSNTTNATVAPVRIDITWSNYGSTSQWQWCETAGCPIVQSSITGPNPGTPVVITSGVRVTIASLDAHSGGKFSIRLKTNRGIYPKTNTAVTRPAGSGSLFHNGGSTATSQDTVETLVVGPVLVVEKSIVTVGSIFAGQNARFTLKVGNATGTGDKDISGNIRADARTATNVILHDPIPQTSVWVNQSESITAGISPTLVTVGAATKIQWIIPSLAVGQSVSFDLVFKKLDAIPCNVNNSNFTATANEMPWTSDQQTARYTVTGAGKSVPVIAPLLIKTITATPLADSVGGPYYGEESRIVITVENHWPEDIQGITLTYTIQDNAYFLPGTAIPENTLVSTPPPNTLGGSLVWFFNFNEHATASGPAVRTFSFVIRSGYKIRTTGGKAGLNVPPEIPSACIQPKDGFQAFYPRLKVKKYTTADNTFISPNFIVELGERFEYIIEVKNWGPEDADGVTIIDELPGTILDNADFRFYAMLEGPAPSSISDGHDGTLIWNDVHIAAGDTFRLRYKMTVGGDDYESYCNLVKLSFGLENYTIVAYTGLPSGQQAGKVCVKISPPVDLSKTANKTVVDPGEEITYTISLTNWDTEVQSLGIVDKLPPNMTYVRTVATSGGMGEPSQIVVGQNIYLHYARQAVQPNQTIWVTLVTKVTDQCKPGPYPNEAMFTIEDGSRIYMVPHVTWPLVMVCGELDFQKQADRPEVGLGEDLYYLLTINNMDDKIVTDTVVLDILPPDFHFVGMDSGGTILTLPTTRTLDDGREEVKWRLNTIAAKAKVTIKFKARSGIVVGDMLNEMYIDPADGGNCATRCFTRDGKEYATFTVKVKPLMTVEGHVSLPNNMCADMGSTQTYTISLVNTNKYQDYNGVEVRLNLPFGLKYLRMAPTNDNIGQQPSIINTPNGGTRLTWRSLVVPKYTGGFGNQLDIIVLLRVARVAGELDTVINVTAANGVIPKDDSRQDPTIVVCATVPAVVKEANRDVARAGQEVIYSITVVNPADTPANVALTDLLPQGFSYIELREGPGEPDRAMDNGRERLTWPSISLPAWVQGQRIPSVTYIFAVQVGTDPGGFVNTVSQIGGSPMLNSDNASVKVYVGADTFVPLILLTY